MPYEALIAEGREHLRSWRLDEALAAFDAALQLRPHDAAAHYLRGETLFLQRRLDEALASHAASQRHDLDGDWSGRGTAMSGMVPGDFGWMSHMLRGDLARAWQLADRDREQRRRAGITGRSWPRHMRPVWDGRPLAGARVLVRCYHGLGDTIQFIRYVPLLARIAARVSVEAQPELLGVLRQIPGITGLHALSETQERGCGDFGCDTEVDVTELPHAFGTTVDTIPAPIPYLRPDPVRAAEAAGRLAALPPGLAVGIVWAAGAWKPERSVPPAYLAPLAGISGVRFVNLQRGSAAERWRGAGGLPEMADIFSSDDIEDAAATIANLDLVISVDTMVAHLAGAIGVPVWLMLHFAADWRWLVERCDSPWYPTIRLFRQAAPGDWDGVVAAVSAALRRWAAETAISPPPARADAFASAAVPPPR